jgi:hypothetical protein
MLALREHSKTVISRTHCAETVLGAPKHSKKERKLEEKKKETSTTRNSISGEATQSAILGGSQQPSQRLESSVRRKRDEGEGREAEGKVEGSSPRTRQLKLVRRVGDSVLAVRTLLIPPSNLTDLHSLSPAPRPHRDSKSTVALTE